MGRDEQTVDPAGGALPEREAQAQVKPPTSSRRRGVVGDGGE
ncbi:MAG TPA: hypothetical protein VIR58_09605 [Acidimicrobiales bacterium]